MKKAILIIIVILFLVIGGYFLLRGGYKPSSPVAPEITAPSQEKEITVIGTEFAFNPSAISVLAGERVKIIFQNNGGAPHNLIIEGLGVSTKTIGSGKTDTIEFTAPTSGTYTIFCSVPGHRAAGMEGNLTVE